MEVEDLVEYQGYLIREGESKRLDTFAVHEKSWDKLVALTTPDDVVMDCGGYIGTTARRFALQGARVVTYEPFPDHLRVLRKNLDAYPRVEVVGAALGPAAMQAAKFYVSAKSGMSHSLVYRRRKQTEMTVPVLAFRAELQRVQPTVVKMDIEGMEYALLQDIMAFEPGIRAFGLEFQLLKQPGHQEAIDSFLEQFPRAGWSWVMGPRVGGAWRDIIEFVAVRPGAIE